MNSPMPKQNGPVSLGGGGLSAQKGLCEIHKACLNVLADFILHLGGCFLSYAILLSLQIFLPAFVAHPVTLKGSCHNAFTSH